MNSATLQREEIASGAVTIWTLDPLHSTIGFSISHMLFATVHGHFTGFQGMIRYNGDQPEAVGARIDAATINTGIAKRDEHLRSGDFFEVATYPAISFRSTRVEPVSVLNGDRWSVVGDLTIRDITRSVELVAEQITSRPNQRGAEYNTFEASAKFSRHDFDLGMNVPLNGGGLVIGDAVSISITAQAVRSPTGAT